MVNKMRKDLLDSYMNETEKMEIAKCKSVGKKKGKEAKKYDQCIRRNVQRTLTEQVSIDGKLVTRAEALGQYYVLGLMEKAKVGELSSKEMVDTMKITGEYVEEVSVKSNALEEMMKLIADKNEY